MSSKFSSISCLQPTFKSPSNRVLASCYVGSLELHTVLLSRGERDVIGLRFQKLWCHVVVIYSVIVSYAFVWIHILNGLEYPKKRELLWLAQEQLKACVH